jgi:hypothetical protein
LVDARAAFERAAQARDAVQQPLALHIAAAAQARAFAEADEDDAIALLLAA